MPRRRLGVALLFSEPVRSELIGLRRALGCPSLRRMDPHITLVPPVNVREEALPEAMALLRRASCSSQPIHVELTGARTFSPGAPVLYLGVEDARGEHPGVQEAGVWENRIGGPQAIDRLRRAVFQPPLQRRVDHSFVAHVTLHEDAGGELISAALVALARFQRNVTFDGVALLQQDPSHVWRPIGEWQLGMGGVRGRGGFEVDLSWASVIAPDVAGLFETQPARPVGGGLERVVEASLANTLAGALILQETNEQWMITAIAVLPRHRGYGVGDQLVREVVARAAEVGAEVVAFNPAPWLAARGVRG